MNCFSKDGCWNLQDNGELRNDERYYCTKLCKYINPSYISDCDNYTEIQSCPTCIFSDPEVWRTGSIDCIGYKCTKMDKNISYINNNPQLNNYSSFPLCPTNGWSKV